MAAAMANGGDGGSQWREQRRGGDAERKIATGDSESGPGGVWRRWRCLGVGDAGRQGGGGRGTCRRAAATRARPPGRSLRTVALVGWAGQLASQVGFGGAR